MPEWFPTPYTVGWHHSDPNGEDGEGNPEVSYTPPLDEPGTPLKVHAIQPARSTEPEINRVIHDIDLLCPVGTEGKPQDVVDLPDGVQYEVVGWPADWSKGPFHPGFGGVEVQLKRVTG